MNLKLHNLTYTTMIFGAWLTLHSKAPSRMTTGTMIRGGGGHRSCASSTGACRACHAPDGKLIEERYTLGALSTGTYRFYETLRWERWRGPTFVAGPNGRQHTRDDDGDVMILRTSRSSHLDLDGGIVCDWREGDVW